MKEKQVNKDQIHRSGFIRIFGLGAFGSVINSGLISGADDFNVDDYNQEAKIENDVIDMPKPNVLSVKRYNNK